MKVYSEKYLPNPYPDPIDDGTWEDDGGFVAKPNYQAWAMEVGGTMLFGGSSYPETILVMHPLTYAEYEHIVKQ